MTFPRIKAVGWQVNEKVTSPQLNQLDVDHSNSLDKTGDNASNGGGISGRIDILGGGELRVQSSGFITVESGGGVNFFGSSSQTFNNSSGLTFNNSAGMTLNGTGNLIVGSSASILMSGTENITSGGTLGINSGATQHVKSGATLYIDSGATESVSGTVSVLAGANVNYAGGSNLNLNSGSFANLTSSTVISSGSIWSITGDTMDFQNGGGGFLTVGTGNTLTVAGTQKNTAFPKFITPQSRNSNMSIHTGCVNSGTWQKIDVGIQNTGGTSPIPLLYVPLDKLHNGATLSSVFIAFFVGSPHSGVPQFLPDFSVFRSNSFSSPTSVQYLNNVGVQSPANPGSGSAWYASGGIQYFQYICNQNNVIDNTTYTYALSIADENGTNSLGSNAYLCVVAVNDIIPDLSWNI